MAKVAAQKKLEFSSPSEMARYCLDANDGDWEAAKQHMYSLLVSETHLYEQFAVPIIHTAITQWVTGCSQQTRATFWPKANPDRATTDGALDRIATRNLYNWPLAGGKRLGDATKPELLENAAFNKAAATVRMRRAVWLQLIAKKMKGKKTVRQQLTEDALEALQREADEWKP